MYYSSGWSLLPGLKSVHGPVPNAACDPAAYRLGTFLHAAQDADWTGNGGQRTTLSARLRFAAHMVLALRALRDAAGALEELQALDDLQVRFTRCISV